MSGSLPERPDAGQLRRQAKELRDAAQQGDAAAMERLARHLVTAPGRAVRLSAAQLVIARELGFASWPRLIAAVEAGPASRRRVLDLVAASVEGRLRRAREIVRADPEMAGRSLLAASVLGDAGAVREHLAADPAAAVALDNGRGWPPLLYVCYSRWHQIDPSRAPGLAEVARLLLEGGASADTNDGGRLRFRSAGRAHRAHRLAGSVRTIRRTGRHRGTRPGVDRGPPAGMRVTPGRSRSGQAADSLDDGGSLGGGVRE